MAESHLCNMNMCLRCSNASKSRANVTNHETHSQHTSSLTSALHKILLKMKSIHKCLCTHFYIWSLIKGQNNGSTPFEATHPCQAAEKGWHDFARSEILSINKMPFDWYCDWPWCPSGLICFFQPRSPTGFSKKITMFDWRISWWFFVTSSPSYIRVIANQKAKAIEEK